MLIRNTQPRVTFVGFLGMMSEPLRLNPGVNEVPDDRWTEAEKNANVKAMVSSGVLEIASAQNFTALPTRHAVVTAGEVFHVGLLRKWLSSEKRPDVCTAIQNQIDKILTVPKKQD